MNFRVFLHLLGELGPDERILDIGCGCGQIALSLMPYLAGKGGYVGCDVSEEAVNWCRSHIASRDERFSFYHMDVRNGMYNPGGKEPAGSYRLSSQWGKFDLILLKSVFTHMRPDEVANYVSQLAPLLTEGGRCLATFFLLNEDQRALGREGKNLISFVPGDGGAAYVSPDVPEAIVGYEEPVVLSMIETCGLSVCTPIRYGSWTGRRDGLSHQDILLLRKNSGNR